MEDLAALVLRSVAGAIFVAQGYRKLFGAPDAHHGRSNLVSMIPGRASWHSSPAPSSWCSGRWC
jgi:uncharacterized membrane protein YphA (DoxX/SURF4 family)